MANAEVTVEVPHLESEEETQRSVVDEHGKLENNATEKSAPKDGGCTKTDGRWLSFISIRKGNFLPMWNNIFVVSCVLAVSIDPLFFYIPIINEKKKCLHFDTRLKAIALVLRLLTDHFYIVDIAMRLLTSIPKRKSSAVTKTEAEAPNSKGKVSIDRVLEIAKMTWAKTNRVYVLIDILAVLPVPQVGMFVFFSKMKGPGCSKEERFFDVLILFQFVPRVLPIYLLCRERKRTLNKASMWTKGVFNFFLYILASHVLGALWYFFAIEREMDCWHSACKRHNKGCQSRSFSCSERRDSLRDISLLLNQNCPINLPEEIMKGKPFDFGIFADALDSGLVQSTDYPQKFLNCFWWGLKNLSSLGQNLHTSTYAWENLFAVFICITGLLLFIYLIGNLQTYLQFATTRSEKVRRKMKTKNLEVDLWLSRKGLPSNLKAVIMHIIQQKLDQNKDVPVDDILSVLPSAHSKYIKRYLRLATLKKVPMLQTMGVRLLKAIGEHLEPVDYPEDTCIIKEEEQLNKMIFITHGTVHSYKTNGKGGKIGSNFLEKGDFYGAEELLSWASKLSFSEGLPKSTRMVKPVTKVEVFTLSADDLKSIAIKYWWNFTKNKDLNDFDQSLLEEYAVSSIEKEIRRRRQGKKKRTISSLNKLATGQGSASKKLQQVISRVMRDQLPSPVGALDH